MFSHFPTKKLQLVCLHEQYRRNVASFHFFSLNAHSISCIESLSSCAIYTAVYSFICTHTFTLQKFSYGNEF